MSAGAAVLAFGGASKQTEATIATASNDIISTNETKEGKVSIVTTSVASSPTRKKTNSSSPKSGKKKKRPK
jgi:hypothetical protein